MSEAMIIELMRTALITAAIVGGPILLTALVVGITISLFMAVTQINEATLTFIPKIIAVGTVFMFLSPWILGKLKFYMTFMLGNLSHFIR